MAGRPDYPLPAAIKTVLSGISARSGIRAYRAGGGKVGNEAWFGLVSHLRVAYADQLTEATRRLDRRPTPDEVGMIPTRRATGMWQQATVFLRSKETGEVYSQIYTYKTDTLLTRQRIVDKAHAAAAAGSAGSLNPEDDRVLGVAYMSTSVLAPGLA